MISMIRGMVLRAGTHPGCETSTNLRLFRSENVLLAGQIEKKVKR